MSSAPVTVKTEPVPGFPNGVLIRPCGMLDPSTLSEFEKTMAICESNGMKQWVIDLSEATFLSSAAWALLIQLARRLQASGGKLVLCALPEAIAEVHQDLDLGRFLPVTATVTDAATQLH